jgi:hypothetical protein
MIYQLITDTNENIFFIFLKSRLFDLIIFKYLHFLVAKT